MQSQAYNDSRIALTTRALDAKAQKNLSCRIWPTAPAGPWPTPPPPSPASPPRHQFEPTRHHVGLTKAGGGPTKPHPRLPPGGASCSTRCRVNNSDAHRAR